MISAKEHYSELLALTKTYLLNEYVISDRIFSEAETYFYFRSYSLQQKESSLQQKESKTPASQKNEKTPLSKNFSPKSQTLARQEISSDKIPPEIIHEAPIPPPIVKKNEEIQKKEKPFFALEMPPALQPANFDDLRKILFEKFPHIRFIDQLPDDAEAQKFAKMWLQEKKSPQVLLLSFDEIPKHLTFLSNIGKTLELYGFPSTIANAIKIEQASEWEEWLQSKELKLVIASSSGFYHLTELQKSYREGTKQGHHHLGNSLLLLLADLSFYFKEPALKPSLWSAIKGLLAIPSATS